MAEPKRDISSAESGANEEEQEQRIARHHRHHHMGGPSFGRAHKMRMMGGMGQMMGGRVGRMACPECGGPMAFIEEGPNRGKGPAKRDDQEVKRVVEEVLTEDPWLDASNIQVSVENGVVTLTGKVDSRATKRRAEAVTDLVFGVFDINNQLQIEKPAA